MRLNYALEILEEVNCRSISATYEVSFNRSVNIFLQMKRWNQYIILYNVVKEILYNNQLIYLSTLPVLHMKQNYKVQT